MQAEAAYQPIPSDRSLVPVKVGRPTKYRPDYADAVEKLCLLGATDQQLAKFFGVEVSTIYLWKLVHPEFSEAEKRGKIGADIEVVEFLHKKATGKIGKEVGDTTAAIFWLKNRQRSYWSDRQEHAHVHAVTVSHENRLERIARLEREGKL